MFGFIISFIIRVWRRTDLSSGLRNEFLIKFEHCKLGRIENLVTELAVTLYTENLQVDITT